MRVQLEDGSEQDVLAAYMGAEGRYEDYVYLKMIEREWKRPSRDTDALLDVPERNRPSARAGLVVVFWSYFETRVERLLRDGMRELPKSVRDELLQRYATIGSRADRLYKILFSTTYWSDLTDLGYESSRALLQRVQERRNTFAHGQPEAIDDALVRDLVEGLRTEHEAWIAVFNRRATGASYWHTRT